MRWLLASVLVSAIVPVAACTPPLYTSDGTVDGGETHVEKGGDSPEDDVDAGHRNPEDPLDGMPTGTDSLQKVCARNNGDVAAQALCDSPTPKIGSLADMERVLGLDFKRPTGQNGANGNPAFAMSANSSALSGRFVSAINPAVIIFSPQRTEKFVSTMFVRGEPFLEIAARDTKKDRFVFYLVHFEQDCDATHSCTNADRLTEKVEQNWTKWSIYQDQDLANTTLDCLHCHQPGGPKTDPILRLQERVLPWTHWLGQVDANAQSLVADFQAAHRDETYGTVPKALVPQSDAAILQGVIDTFGPSPQPNEYDSPRINQELRRLGGGGGDTSGAASPTWQAIYANAVAGKAIPVPYHHAKITDPQKLGAMTRAYNAFESGSSKDLPDIRDVFLDSALPDLGVVPKAGLDARGILTQMCSQCHNANVDSSLSKSHFDTSKLDSLDAPTKAMIMSRLQLDPKDVRHMPPARMKTLDPASLQLVLDFLKK